MSGIFLSYSRADSVLADQIVRGLRAVGVVVWWDEDMRSIDWHQELERQISELAGIVVIWTPNSASSDHVKDEARLGLETGKLVNVIAGLPKPPFPYDRVNGLPLDGWTGREPHRGWSRLIETVEEKVVERGGTQVGVFTAAQTLREETLRQKQQALAKAQEALQEAQTREGEIFEAAKAAQATLDRAEEQHQRVVEMRATHLIMSAAQQEYETARTAKEQADQAQRAAKSELNEVAREVSRAIAALEAEVSSNDRQANQPPPPNPPAAGSVRTAPPPPVAAAPAPEPSKPAKAPPAAQVEPPVPTPEAPVQAATPEPPAHASQPAPAPEPAPAPAPAARATAPAAAAPAPAPKPAPTPAPAAAAATVAAAATATAAPSPAKAPTPTHAPPAAGQPAAASGLPILPLAAGAVILVAALGVGVLMMMHHPAPPGGRPASSASRAAMAPAQTPVRPATPSAPATVDPMAAAIASATALNGTWAPQGLTCDSAVRVFVSNGALSLTSAGTTTDAKILPSSQPGSVNVQAADGAYTYTLGKDNVLSVNGPSGPAMKMTKCAG